MVLANDYLVWWAAQVVSLAILVWAFLRWRPGFLKGRTIKQLLGDVLDARAEQIRSQLEAAEVSRKEAERLREEAEAEIVTAKQEAETIVERAESTSAAIQKEMQQKAEEEFRRILAQAREAIDYERRQAELALRHRAADIVVDAARQIVEDYLEPAADQRIIDTSLDEMVNLS